MADPLLTNQHARRLLSMADALDKRGGGWQAEVDDLRMAAAEINRLEKLVPADEPSASPWCHIACGAPLPSQYAICLKCEVERLQRWRTLAIERRGIGSDEVVILDLDSEIIPVNREETPCPICGKPWHSGHTEQERAECDEAL